MKRGIQGGSQPPSARMLPLQHITAPLTPIACGILSQRGFPHGKSACSVSACGCDWNGSMATGHYRFETKMIGRRVKGVDKSVSMVAKAAYRSGQSLHDDRADKTFNYRPRAQEVIYSEIMSPQNAPAGSRSQARTFRPGHGNNATRGNNSGTRSRWSKKKRLATRPRVYRLAAARPEPRAAN